MLGRLKYVFMAHSDPIWKYVDDFERELFSPSLGLDPRIVDVFKQFRSLRL